MRAAAAALCVLTLTLPAHAQKAQKAPKRQRNAGFKRNDPSNPFSEIVRKTEPLTPAEEQKAFHLPPGFDIELVAAEPQIGKPINMQFDAQGRLWVSMSREYPFPAPEGKPARDTIRILSDFASNGRAGNIETFATNLNIPIGLYPYKDGAIAYSIPYLWHFFDTNHDGHADYREKFLGRFGFEKDTHGMTSSFRRGYDGWLYANHGFNNTSTLTASDGSSITMNSGNTYRVKIDGSHIEQYTWGRVNPFGLIFDPLGNIYSADCETLPIYQLLRGAYYPSFGKPHDGLGFAPAMMNHKHGSTAIAGIVYYAATNFPPAFRSNIFVGNVMTGRIDRDSLEEHGSTWLANEQPDFLVSDDPWFRPVDMQQGPDGAIYVADFYNRIIGHYEVPLDHPGRDRERGRIWRIVYRGTNAPAKLSAPQDFNIAKAPAKKLIEELGNENFTIRMLAMNELTDRIGPSCTNEIVKMIDSKKANDWQVIHGLWVLYRFNALDPNLLAAAAHDSSRAVRVHVMRILSETPSLSDAQYSLLRNTLANDPDGLVQRCAADALGRHPQLENIRPLLDALHWASSEDTHLIHVLRMALRDHLQHNSIFANLPLPQWNKLDEESVVDVVLGTTNTASAKFLLHHLTQYPESREVAANELRHAARYLPKEQINDLAKFVRAHYKDDVDFQLALFQSVEEGLAQRGEQPGELMRDWAAELARNEADSLGKQTLAWHNTPLEHAPTANPWMLQTRPSADGDNTSRFLSSLPAGEHLTGTLRSETFVCPPKLAFWLAGHRGFPDKQGHKKNAVRLRDASTGEILAESFPPRNDTAQKVEWNLSAPASRQEKVYMEAVDGDNAAAYAWLAFGRLDPQVVPWPLGDPRSTGQKQADVANLAREFKLAELEPTLVKWLQDPGMGNEAREAAARALVAIDPEPNVALISAVAANPAENAALRENMAAALASVNSSAARLAILDSLRNAPDRLQVRMALALAGSGDGAETLLHVAEEGKVSPRLLLDRSMKERFTAAKPANYEERIAKLTKGLTPANEQLQKVIDERYSKFIPSKWDPEKGAKVFAQNCMVCHSMDNKGGAVGPHLDGVGLRGAARLIEDILDPSRNVDPSFRYSIVTLKNGDVIAGLQRREEGATVVFVDATGKETAIAKSDIEKRVESTSSLMPDGFADAIPVNDFYNLLSYLLSKGSATAKK